MPTASIDFDRNRLRRLRRNLRAWYEKHARDLPWRRTDDPYRIWISEIMLQQTTVAAVVGYYQRFITRFGNIEQLAQADEDDVLRVWEGLGYYSRARNIHKTARKIVEEYGGRFPNDFDDLLSLPGIGPYTAGAIASIAFDQRAPIVEANTLRLYSRLLGYRGDPRSGNGQSVLWTFARDVLPRKFPGLFNQALMELGGTVCTPDEPNCKMCPLKSCCRAFADGTQGEIPRRQRRPPVTRLTEAAIAVRKNGAYLLRRCGRTERWAGLWDFPRFGLDRNTLPIGTIRDSISRQVRQELESKLEQSSGITASLGDLETEIKHSVTRYRIQLLCFRAEFNRGSITRGSSLRWVKPSDFDVYPLSVTGRKFADLLV